MIQTPPIGVTRKQQEQQAVQASTVVQALSEAVARIRGIENPWTTPCCKEGCDIDKACKCNVHAAESRHPHGWGWGFSSEPRSMSMGVRRGKCGGGSGFGGTFEFPVSF